MITTQAEKNVLLTESWKLVGAAIRSVKLPEDDYSDLRASCIEAANRAIDDWERDGGRSISSWVYRYIIQAKRDYFRSKGRACRSINEESVCFSDLSSGIESVPSGDFPFEDEEVHEDSKHAAMMQDMEIIIDRARNDGVLSEREYRMLVSRRTGGTYRRMAEDEGMSPGGVYKIIEAAVAKIRLAYRTAE